MPSLTKTQTIRLISTHLVSMIPSFNGWKMSMTGLSRQLWWGHQIPAWYNAEGEMYVGEEAPEGDGWKQDEDVLDTWFSSALWPFSTMGWPDVDSEDFKRYFPTSTLVTGYDIIFFWVSRMIFQSLEFTGRQPFKMFLFTVSSVTSKDVRCLSLSVTGLTQWMLSRNTVPMPFVGSFQTVLHQVKTCVSLTRKWMRLGTSLTRFGISRYILMNNEGLTLMRRVKM